MGQLWLGDGRWGCTETSDLKRVDATALPAASEHQAGAEERQATCPGGSDPEVVVAGDASRGGCLLSTSVLQVEAA